MAPERIPYESMADRDLLIILAKSYNDLTLRVESYCQRVNKFDDRMTKIEAKYRDHYSDNPASPKIEAAKKTGVIAAFVGIIYALIELIKNKWV